MKESIEEIGDGDEWAGIEIEIEEDRPQSILNRFSELLHNEWVTLDTGQRVFIGDGGEFQPGGPGSAPVDEGSAAPRTPSSRSGLPPASSTPFNRESPMKGKKVEGEYKAKHPPNRDLPDNARPTVTTEQAVALQRYAAMDYQDINRSLREGISLDEDMTGVRDQLLDAMDRAEPFDEPVQVRRGMKLSAADRNTLMAQLQAHIASGEPLTMNGFISTSSGDTMPRGFTGNVEMVISARQGIDMNAYTTKPKERELLLNHGSQFTVSRIEQVGNRQVVYMEQVI